MIILVQCTDQVGLVSSISGLLADKGINIISLREHVDQTENLFFIRLVTSFINDPEMLRTEMKAVLPTNAIISINSKTKKNIVILVTKEYHCLTDILVKHFFNKLDAEILAVIGNHHTLKDVCDRFKIPFFLVSHEQKSKEEFEQSMVTIIDSLIPDYVVLAKFMRILSPTFVGRYAKKVINIHHSFLPAFIGGSPYRQAFERGVKLIGATAHFVTNDLDEGPIITQATIPVTHSLSVKDMIEAGKEIEASVLAKALLLLFDDRVFVHGNKTIVFDT